MLKNDFSITTHACWKPLCRAKSARSTIVTSKGACANCFAVESPPNPAPIITTRGKMEWLGVIFKLASLQLMDAGRRVALYGHRAPQSQEHLKGSEQYPAQKGKYRLAIEAIAACYACSPCSEAAWSIARSYRNRSHSAFYVSCNSASFSQPIHARAIGFRRNNPCSHT